SLAGQTVVVIGGTSGIGLETARRARAEGAGVILTARDPDRLRRVGQELAARTAAFDATDFGRLRKFFDELPAPIDHVLVTGPGSLRRAAAVFNQGGGRWRPGGPSPAAAGGRRERRGQGPPGGAVVFQGRPRRPPRGAGARVDLGSHGRRPRHDEEPRARARS